MTKILQLRSTFNGALQTLVRQESAAGPGQLPFFTEGNQRLQARRMRLERPLWCTRFWELLPPALHSDSHRCPRNSLQEIFREVQRQERRMMALKKSEGDTDLPWGNDQVGTGKTNQRRKEGQRRGRQEGRRRAGEEWIGCRGHRGVKWMRAPAVPGCPCMCLARAESRARITISAQSHRQGHWT